MNNSNDIYKHRINMVIDYINLNLHKSFSIEELAAVAYFSPFHFHRIFVAITGETVNSFTNRVRLEKAARLLLYSKKKFEDISFECGFSSISTFSRAFKKYFGYSASFYKKNGNFENSKICKILYPINEYFYNMNLDELNIKFPVEIRNFPKRKIAYIRVFDSYKKGVVINAFESIINWAKKKELYESESIFGMSIDDPFVTPKKKYRYEVCITLPSNFELDDNDKIETSFIPQCRYAVLTVSGNLKMVATGINYLYKHWLINNSYEPEHQPGLEIFLDKENICNWEHLDLELCIPIKKINNKK